MVVIGRLLIRKSRQVMWRRGGRGGVERVTRGERGGDREASERRE